jgi:hypothetical protein
VPNVNGFSAKIEIDKADKHGKDAMAGLDKKGSAGIRQQGLAFREKTWYTIL